MKTKFIALTATFASLYAIGTIGLMPIAYSLIQVRLTDALIALSFIPEIGWGAVVGVTVGNLVADAFSPYGFPDLILGTIANFIASYICMKFGRTKIRHNLLIGTLIASVVIAAIIGPGLLYGIYRVASPELCFVTVLIGEMISVTVLGSILTKAILKTRIVKNKPMHLKA